MKQEEQHTETELDDEELDGIGDLKDENLDLDLQAVIVTEAGIAASSELSPKLALGEGGGGLREGIGDGLEVGLELVGGILLLSEGGVLRVLIGSRVCFRSGQYQVSY